MRDISQLNTVNSYRHLFHRAVVLAPLGYLRKEFKMSYTHRSGEPDYLLPLERSDRLVVNDEGFFYRTRECDLIGPFATELAARADLKFFINVTRIEQNISAENLFEKV